MLEGRLRFDGSGVQIVAPGEGTVLAEGVLVAHPGHQSVAGLEIASAVQFTGTLTDAGLKAASS